MMCGLHLLVFRHPWSHLLVLTLAILAVTHSAPSCDDWVEDGHRPVAFLQTDVRLRGQGLAVDFQAGRPSSKLRPWGRTFFSADPSASADFFVKYFKAERLSLPDCSLGQRAAVRLSVAYGDEPQTLLFVHEPAVGAQDLLHQISDAGDKILNTFGPSEYAVFIPWVDNHDAYFNNTALNVSAMIEDQLPMQLYVDPFDGIPVLHLHIPGTLWTVGPGASAVITPEQLQLLEGRWLQPFPELCRQDSARLEVAKPGWTKSTYMSARPDIAAKFMVDIFGAEVLEPAFPWPPQDNCTSVQWVILPESLLQVHFVLSKGWELNGFSIQEETKKMDPLPALQSKSLHAAMHNSLVFTADSLDEYVLRLQAQSLPYELLRSCAEGQLPESYVLIVVIPENAITMQVRSQHVSIGLRNSNCSSCSLDDSLVFPLE